MTTAARKAGNGSGYSTGYTLVVAVDEANKPTSDRVIPIFGTWQEMELLRERLPVLKQGSMYMAAEQDKITILGIAKELYDKGRIIDPEPNRHWSSSAYNKKMPLMCTFDATKDYLYHCLGIKLANDDREFFIEHPLTTPEGVPMPDTLRVVQELIDPYGLRINKVQLAPGQMVKGDLAQWTKILGVNPLALTDYSTSNSAWRTASKDETEYNFEYVDKCLKPGVHCGGGEGGGTGHATYLSPRSNRENATMSFQITKSRYAVWYKQPVFEQIVQSAVQTEAAKDYVLDAALIYDEVLALYTKPMERNTPQTQDKRSSKNGKVKKGDRAPREWSSVKALYPFGNCQRCGVVLPSFAKPKRPTYYDVPGICDSCWSVWIHNICVCEETKRCAASAFGYTAISASGEDRIFATCSGCNTEYYANDSCADFGKMYEAIVAHKSLQVEATANGILIPEADMIHEGDEMDGYGFM